MLDNRLIATQLWFGRGGTSMIIYSIYGVSGARWEIQKRSYLHKLLKAIEVDRISRGQIPCILMGDFNMEISESQVLSDALASQFWFDLRTSGDAEQQHKATCHKGKGSYIDHIFVSPHLFDQCFNFQIQEFPEFKDHSVLTANIWVPTAVQTHTSLRPVHTFPTLNRASSASNTFQNQIPRQFKDAISNGDVDKAFKSWSSSFERVLHKIAMLQGHDVPQRAAAHRGQISFHEQRLHPRVMHDSASTLKGRALWKGYGRALELSKMAVGTRQEKTLAKLQSAKKWLSADHLVTFDALTSQTCSKDIGYELVQLFEKAVDENEKADKKERILKWKQSHRKATKDTYSFLKHKSPRADVRLSMVEGVPTANLHTRLSSIAQVWSEIYNQHKNNEPTLREFLVEYGPTMQTHIANIPDLSESLIYETLTKTKMSAPGLDHIAINELQVAVSYCPVLLSSLCSLLQCVEKFNKWPGPLTKGAVVFIPKESENEFLTPDKYRPITILSTIYRLWSAVRHNQLAELWFPFWRHPQCFGGKGCQAADQLAYLTCQQFQQAQRSNKAVTGVSFDLAKCFDSVPIHLALDIVHFRGAPTKIVQCIKSFYQNHEKFYRLEGRYMKPCKPANGLVQGCPLSMLIVSTLICSWLEFSSSRIPNSVCRSYADDLSGVVQADSPKEVKKVFNKYMSPPRPSQDLLA